MTEHILAVLPSQGLGGGIERYWGWLRDVADEGGNTDVHDVAYLAPGQRSSPQHKAGFVFRVFSAARTLRTAHDVDVIVLHPNLALMAWLACRWSGLAARRFILASYGTDIWGLGRLERWAIRHLPLEHVTISSFSAGALAPTGPATIVAPGVPEPWFDLLTRPGGDGDHRGADAARDGAGPGERPVEVLTVFRLDDPGKGLPQIVEAMELVHQRTGQELRLTVAGSGDLPDDLRRSTDARPWITVARDLTDDGLAARYRRADVFVLATRTTFTGTLSGEGFGIVLVEAQLAGTPVVAPAHGGSDDAFLDGITGVKPVDESAAALADAIEPLVTDAQLRDALGANARAWARAAFEPGRRNAHVRRLLGWDHAGPGATTAATHHLGVSLSPRSEPGPGPG